MPSYKTHVSINLFLGLPLTLVALKHTVQVEPTEIACFSAAFIYGTIFLHPDLDLARNIRLFSLKGLLTLPFRPYSYLFRHRGISHIPIIGTLSRILWLIFFFYFIFTCLNWAMPNVIEYNGVYIAFALAGVAAADLIHVLLDKIT
ncbi:MAG: hypothetical protein COT85_01455 [Chlamydiae bacterium CG10_big_fil_rev_8_21_14_0_10_42_34]|nr:MAG: hypothetical protein COT85_01455 [Chlamydiae bacterium CG10_big_fil_rev_8_21_14_0_10_42_34]